MFIGVGGKLVRDGIELAKEKAPAIIFMKGLDAIGTKRFDKRAVIVKCNEPCWSFSISSMDLAVMRELRYVNCCISFVSEFNKLFTIGHRGHESYRYP